MKKFLIFSTIVSFLTICLFIFALTSYAAPPNQGTQTLRSEGGNVNIETGSTGDIQFATNNTRRWHIDGTTGALTSDGGATLICPLDPTTTFTTLTGDGNTASIIVGDSSIPAYIGAGATPNLYLAKSSAAGIDNVAIWNYGTTAAGGPDIKFLRTRAATSAGGAIVQSGDTIGKFLFRGDNGTSTTAAASIIVTVDGTPGASNDMPGAIDFQTTPDGSGTPASAFKIKNTGDLVYGAPSSSTMNLLAVDDTRRTFLCGGSANGNGNGAFLQLNGASNSAGLATLASSTASGSTVTLSVGSSNGSLNIKTNNGTTRWTVDAATGLLANDATNGGNISFGKAFTGLVEQTGTAAAAGTTQTDATALVATLNNVTAADGTKGVKLTALSGFSAGQKVIVINNAGSALKLYSNAAGETINTTAGTTAYSIAARAIARCYKYDSTNWFCG